MEEQLIKGIQSSLDLLRECEKETAVTVSDTQLSEMVMRLFRNEDMEGLERLMQMKKVERQFVDELQAFVMRWSNRLEALHA
ncbi:hypothetical protein [Ferroacidibacillus organovorans]|uniref:Uncharacterized protein n=1 Tax=Ferroacidibacillus organovorans TaxID=1765683 RepID=A0A162T533_9BACL|nr:hypothetical protein [Ferroacidibacillus organovorans]KYP80471.1 hypothetical protein AYJ22_02155 [Ferroacidibacillus organovorans]OAG94700.1 hypothetical protein AYW79_03925 [Ferroacidibacillus organovorans]OPG16584.1 hypothetical protein B2M26_06905 [Ferroacidibacillus organovorans]